MDLDTRKYLKRLMEDYAQAILIQSIIQRFATQMSQSEITALTQSAVALLYEGSEYLGIGQDGELILEGSDEGSDEITENETTDGPPVLEELPEEQPVPTKKSKKDDYT